MIYFLPSAFIFSCEIAVKVAGMLNKFCSVKAGLDDVAWFRLYADRSRPQLTKPQLERDTCFVKMSINFDWQQLP